VLKLRQFGGIGSACVVAFGFAAGIGTHTAMAQTATTPGITLEGMIVQRSALNTTQFTGEEISGGGNPNYTRFSSDELDNDIAGGLRTTFSGRLFDNPIEFSGLFIAPFVGEITKSGFSQSAGNRTNTTYHEDLNPAADIATGGSDSDRIYGLSIKHQTHLFGAEANLTGAFGMPGLLFGARGLYFGERLASVSYDNANSLPDVNTDNERDRTSTRVDNYMLGLQIGLQGMYEIAPGFSLGGSVKAGLYNNHMERHRTFNRDISGAASNTMGDSISGDQLSQVVEVNPRLSVDLAPGVQLTAAGWFLWANNVSEALPHFSSAADRDDTDLRGNGDVYFYGGSLGLTVQLDQFALGAYSGSDTSVNIRGASREELGDRITQLEAGTVSRGASPVSLHISGQLNQMVLGWDDGGQGNIDIVDNTNSPSRIELQGAARISRGLTAGYRVGFQFENPNSRSVDVTQIASGDDYEDVALRHSSVWLRHNQLGMLEFGHTSPATDNIIHNDLGGVHVAASNDARLIGGKILVRHSDEIEQGNDALISITPMIDFLPSLDTDRRDVISYETPRWQGLTGSTAWGNGDFWDVALRYRLNWNDWKFRGGVGYLRDLAEPSATGGNRDRREFKGSASVIHIPSGIFVSSAFTHREYHGQRSSDLTTAIITPAGTNRPDFDYRYISSGVRRKLSSLGDTSVYGEFAIGSDGVTGRREGGIREVTDSEIRMFGVGIVQRIDSAAMEIYLAARHFEVSVEGVDVSGRTDAEDLEDINLVYAGVKIKF
jgi:hypothetical protein